MAKTSKKVEWEKAPDIKKRIGVLVKSLNEDWLKSSKIHCFRSTGSTARAYARIWGLSRIWQLALGEDPSYIIEVISEKFDPLSDKKKTEVLLHEIAHIPTTFSGALVPHFKKGKRNFHKKVHDLIKQNERMNRKQKWMKLL